MDFTYQLQKSPNSFKDLYFGKLVTAVANRPVRYSNRPYAKVVRNQGNAGFCHSFATGAYKNIQENIENPNSKHDISPLSIAKKVKEIDSFQGIEGSDLLSPCKVICNYGAFLESEYPYSQYVPGSLQFPELPIDKDPARFKAKNYARLTTIDEMKDSVLNTGAALFGVFVFDSFRNSTNGFVRMPNGYMLGGHAMTIIGYDDELMYTYPALDFSPMHTMRGFFEVQNSHDETWGDHGFGWIPYSYFTEVTDIGMPYFLDAYSFIDLSAPYIKNTIKMTVGQTLSFVDGVEFTLDQAPFVDPNTNRTVVPLRFIAEQLGFIVDWNQETQTITMVRR